MPHLRVYQYLILFAIIAGLIRFRRLNPPIIRLFLPFLVLAFIAEIVPRFKLIRFGASNHWWFNIFTVIEFFFYSYFFSRVIVHPKQKQIIQISTLIYLGLATVNIFFIQGFKTFHTYTYSIGSIMIVVWCYLYLRQLLQRAEEMQLLRNPLLWITTGLLFFYLGFFLYMNALEYILVTYADKQGQYFHILGNVLNTLLYGCFLIAMLCSSNNRSSNSSL
jgi:hypothetical protein